MDETKTHRRDSENRIFHHNRKSPISVFDRNLMRVKDSLLIGSAIFAVAVGTTNWVRKPDDLQKDAVLLAGRVTANEGSIRAIRENSQKDSVKLDELIKRTDRIESLIYRLLTNNSQYESNSDKKANSNKG